MAPASARSSAATVIPGLVTIDSVLGYQQAQALGTGIVLTSDGEILTNNHVVESATDISVHDLGNGRTYHGTVVGYDRTGDIAVVQLQGASGLATAALGDSATVAAGQQIAAIGNAGGTGSPTVAPGVVTAVNQSVTASDETGASAEQLAGLIQVNADVVAGDSGGALINSAGKVVGMNTAAARGFGLQLPFGGISIDDGSHQAFAIPINRALSVARQIESGQGSGVVHIGPTAFIGVRVAAVPGGAQVAGLFPDSPARRVGIPVGAVITAVDGRRVTSPAALTNLMDTHHPGDWLRVTWQAGPAQHTVTVVPTAGPVG
jgi:S1-C subfamily serine protease